MCSSEQNTCLRYQYTEQLILIEKGDSKMEGVDLTCSFVSVQADQLYGALMWGPAVLTVLHMLSTWTVPEGMAVSC